MFEKIKSISAHQLIQQFRDIRLVGFVVFGVLVLLVSWSGVSVIESNFELQKQVSKLEQENQVVSLENSNLELQNQYYNSDQYLELAARKQFGKGQAGEKLLLVPKAVALKHTVDIPKADKEADTTPVIIKPMAQRHLEAWMDFFMHRGTTGQ